MDPLRAYLRTRDLNELSRNFRLKRCDCGGYYSNLVECSQMAVHVAVRGAIREQFPVGTVAYFNAYNYDPNCKCVVVGESDLGWQWIRISVTDSGDWLVNGPGGATRSVRAYTALGWHLTLQPVDVVTLALSGIRNQP